MEVEKLISTLEETISLLQKSGPSDWANMSVEELIRDLASVLANIRTSAAIDRQLLGFLFAPTAAIQEIAIDNGWGDAFLRISDVVAQFTGN